MKAPLRHLLALFTLLPSLAIFAHAQITPLGDSYTNTADPTTNYGAPIRPPGPTQARSWFD